MLTFLGGGNDFGGAPFHLSEMKEKRIVINVTLCIPWSADSSHGSILYLNISNYCQGIHKLHIFREIALEKILFSPKS